MGNEIVVNREIYLPILLIIIADLYMRCLKGVLQGSEFVSEMGKQIHIPNYYSPYISNCFVLLDAFNCIKRIVHIKEE